MKNQVIVTPSEVTTKMLMELVTSQCGYWNTESTLNQGVIQRGKARVFITCLANVGEEYAADELVVIRQRLGREPRTFIDLHIGHAPGSDALAAEVTTVIMERWGGIVDTGSKEKSQE